MGKRGWWIAAFYIAFAIVITIIAALAGCSKGEPIPDSGIIRDKSHYPAAEIKHYDCDRDGANCKLDRVEQKPERCTLTIEEDITTKRSEVAIPCNTMDSYKVGDWWLRPGAKSPEPGRELP